MDNIFNEFPSVDLESWQQKILKDLKGGTLDDLKFNDVIEEINYRAFYHRDERDLVSLKPGDFPNTRGSVTLDNNWSNGVYIRVNSEREANKQALDTLMKGADLIYFESVLTETDWQTVLQGVQLEYIKAQFKLSSADEAQTIINIAGSARQNIAFCFDALHEANEALVKLMKSSQNATYVVNGFNIQQIGGTSWQEVAFCLAVGHHKLHELMENGFSCDDAAAQIHFHIGIGPEYFLEIAKIRALRTLWSKIIDAYQPEHACSKNCQLTAIIGHSNKSLRDPHTNLLRQTTEVMSATSADAVITLPYDLYSEAGTSELATRMALNISLLLKEESYLHHVIDAVGGSYSIEKLTTILGEKAWVTFQEIENNGGIGTQEALTIFQKALQTKRDQREQAYTSGKKTLIGVNKYPDPNEQSVKWGDIPSYLDIPFFVAELTKINQTV
jgi:methylmalonyl-CoA mutase